MRRLVLALPVVFLALSYDRVVPDRIFPPSQAVVDSFDQAAPSLPGFNEDLRGGPAQPLSVVLVGRAPAVFAALDGAGWTVVPTSFRGALLRGHRKIADYRLRGRYQDMNWVLSAGRGSRCVLRLWRTGLVDRQWRTFWWGSVELEGEAGPAGRDALRDLLAGALAKSPRSRGLVVLPVPRLPREGIDDRGRPFTTDGRVAVADLR